MKTCRQYQDELLEQLYGLLEDAESAELDRHLAGCPECRRAAEQSRRDRETLGRAARMEDAKMSFQPPEPFLARPIGATWSAKLRLLAAAALVLLVFGLAVYGYDAARTRSIDAGYTRLIVQGPSVIVPGAPRTFQVKTQTPAGLDREVLVNYRLVSPAGQTVSSGQVYSAGSAGISFPVSLEIPTGSRLEVSAEGLDEQAAGSLQMQVAPKRYVVQLSTDKPMYKPGEAVRFRALALERYGLRPDREHQVAFTIRTPQGAVAWQNWVATSRGVAADLFPVDPGLPGGEYTLEAASAEGLFAPEKRSFTVRAYRLPRLKKELKFVRESYGPGETASATLSVERTEGGPAALAKLTITATVDGKEVYQGKAAANLGGAATIEFALPKEIERGEGLLSVAIDDGGTIETAAKPIPIALKKLDVEFFPEGGELVAGLASRCYFTARTTLGKPAALKGWVVDGSGSKVAKVETVHKGLGAFELTPKAAAKYKLLIEEPKDIAGEHVLPAAKAAGVVLGCGKGVTGPGEELPLVIAATAEQSALAVAVYCRGTLVGQDTLTAAAGENRLSLKIDPSAHGVLTVTVYDRSVTPVAERLVYRKSDRKLNVKMDYGLGEFAPGQKVRVALKTTDESGAPVPAALGVSVVDEGLLKMAAEDAPSMVTHFMLATEVGKPKDLEEADFYLAEGAKSAQALDLLLGTQGWRRFAWIDPSQFVQKHGDDAKHLLAMAGYGAGPAVSDNLGRINAQYRAQLDQHQETVGAWKSAVKVGIVLFVLLGLVMLLAAIPSPRVRKVAFSVATATAGVAIVVGLLGHAGLGVRGQAGFAPGETKVLALIQRDVMARNEPRPVEDMARLRKAAAEKPASRGAEDAIADVPLDGLGFVGAIGVAGGAPAKAEELAEADHFEVLKDADKEVGAKKRWHRVDGRLLARVYAHAWQKQADGARRDFTETLFWNPLLVTDERGHAEISFDLCDSVTTFLVRADAHSGAGRLGAGAGKVVSRIPFYMEPKLPVELTFGDRVDLPLAVVNATREEMGVRVGFKFPAELFKLSGEAEQKLELGAEKRGRLYFPFEVVGKSGEAKLLFNGAGGLLEDKVERSIPVVPYGFPKEFAKSGILEKQESFELAMPGEVVPGTLKVQLKVYPSPLATLQGGEEGMLQEPGGCFEQASSTNYPNVMVLQYMGEQRTGDPKIAARAKQVLDRGYKLLAGYECKQKGYEWFGGDPGHEALTAYGLMEFKDMAAVYGVDSGMVERTRRWLLARRDGKGGFGRNSRALDSFGRAPQDITDAYITWAVTEAGQAQGIGKEVEHTGETAAKSEDPYLVALAANALANAGQDPKPLLQKLAAAQAKDGSLTGKSMSITGSTGPNLTAETTALAALAWMRAPAFSANVISAIEWLNKNRQASGRYGATQATILVLKALTAYAKTSAAPDEDGSVGVYNDGKEVGRFDFTKEHRGPINVTGLEAQLHAGTNKLRLTLSTKKVMPYTLAVNYTTPRPPSDEKCAVRLTTALAKAKVAAGESVRVDVTVKNITDGGLAMTTAIIGLPAGLIVRADELKELVKQGKADFYETRNREVILYWRQMAPNAEAKVALNPVAEIPGSFAAPASRAYLYYSDDLKWWVEPLKVEIAR